jgi:hypothetical protein
MTNAHHQAHKQFIFAAPFFLPENEHARSHLGPTECPSERGDRPPYKSGGNNNNSRENRKMRVAQSSLSPAGDRAHTMAKIRPQSLINTTSQRRAHFCTHTREIPQSLRTLCLRWKFSHSAAHVEKNMKKKGE